MLMCHNDVSPFWIVTDNITPFGVTNTNLLLLLYKRQLLLLTYSDNYSLVYQAGIPLLMCRVQLFLLDDSELAILILMCSLLVASVE